jgi:hypothetical protein
MIEMIHTGGVSDAPWPASDHRVRVLDASILPVSERAASAVVGVLNPAVQGAHGTIDSPAGSAAPAAQQFSERVWTDAARLPPDQETTCPTPG